MTVRGNLIIRFCIVVLLFLPQFLCAQSINPQNWSPTWIAPAWERPENMTVDGDISVPGDVGLSQYIEPATCGGVPSCNFQSVAGGYALLCITGSDFSGSKQGISGCGFANK